MISAELNHNPYLLLTSVKFNGQKPRINSQIEKYEHQPLQNWAHLVPGIFYDEMNGYDFDLFFVGTVQDFEEIKSSFLASGVSEEEVRLIHKNEIEDVYTKNQEVESLIRWLRENMNRRFDFEAFWNEHAELFEGTYPYIVLGGATPIETEPDIEVETVCAAEELGSTVLTSIPILFYIDDQNIDSIRADLTKLLVREDIRQDQLFFMIHPGMNVCQVTRTIEDLGVRHPQVVLSCFDEVVKKYIRNFPMSEYIRDAITVFEILFNRIESTLAAENEKSIAVNAEIRTRIDRLEEDITRLKETESLFEQRDNYTKPREFDVARQELIKQIQRWKNRKTKIVGDVEAEAAADEFNLYLSEVYQSFCDTLGSEYATAGDAICVELHAMYAEAQIDTQYVPCDELAAYSVVSCPDIKVELIAMKQITYEAAKNDFFGLLKKSSDEEVKPVRIATSYLEQWREKAVERLLPLAENMMNEATANLAHYYSQQAESYCRHLADLLEKKIAEKNEVSSMLSDEEKKLQQDNDWLATLKDQLYRIERG